MSVNEEPMEFETHFGIVFRCAKKDLSDIVTIDLYERECYTQMNIIEAVAEWAAMHALETRPLLNGFQGYDCVKFEIKP